MILKALRQRDLYHNPDPLGRLVGEANESKVIVEGQETRALLDSGSQLSAISWTWVKKFSLEPKQLQSILQIEGFWWSRSPISRICGGSTKNTGSQSF